MHIAFSKIRVGYGGKVGNVSLIHLFIHSFIPHPGTVLGHEDSVRTRWGESLLSWKTDTKSINTYTNKIIPDSNKSCNGNKMW